MSPADRIELARYGYLDRRAPRKVAAVEGERVPLLDIEHR